MKKIIKGLLFGLAAVSVISCEYNNPNEGKFGNESDTGYVEFNSSSVVNGYSGCEDAVNEVLVPIRLTGVAADETGGGPVNEDGITVNYTITDVIGTTSGNITAGSARIPSDSREGNIVIGISGDITSSIEFVITLTSTNNGNVSIGHPDNTEPVSQTVRINAGAHNLAGTYTVVEDDEFVYTSIVTPGEAANELILTNLYDTDPTSQTRIFVSEDGTVSFPPFEDNYLFTSSNSAQGDIFVEGDTGSADICAGELNFTFALRFGPDQSSVTPPVSVVMTRE